MSKTIGFSLVGAGFLVIIVSFFFRNSLLAGISPSILGVIAIAFVVAGVVLLKQQSSAKPKQLAEVPIYEEDNIVGYRRHKAK